MVHSHRCSVGETDATSLSLYLSFSKGRLWLRATVTRHLHPGDVQAVYEGKPDRARSFCESYASQELPARHLYVFLT